jgi:hypothetical protein
MQKTFKEELEDTFESIKTMQDTFSKRKNRTRQVDKEFFKIFADIENLCESLTKNIQS